ncbi:MAG TPA: hypothetical protein VKJ01_15330 [Candidatus Solibacter sp.]|nr:hypothetical protein [Candidatus Solibacter sp.]
MSLIALILRAYRRACRQLQRHLDRQPNLASALRELVLHQTLMGVVKDDHSSVECFLFHDRGCMLALRAEFNPRRKERFRGDGRTKLPDGVAFRSQGCFLDPYNIFLMQCGRQSPYALVLNGRKFNFWAQPFGFGRGHCTFTSALQEPQDWRKLGIPALERRMTDMYTLVERLGDAYCVLLNGEDAGASILDWYHQHVLLADNLKIRQAARNAAGGRAFPRVLRIDQPYWPLPVFRIAGSRRCVVAESVRLASRWQTIAGDRATECISMAIEEGRVVCYYVPRDRRRTRARGFAGVVGAYECAAGVFIFSEEDEGRRLREAERDEAEGGEAGKGFASLWQILLEVRPEMAADLLACEPASVEV